MPAAARIFDATNHPGMITRGSATVLINWLPAARVTDIHTCTMPPPGGPHPANPIATGSKTVLINALPAARKFDQTGCGATIMGGSPNVQIGG
jgi:uncharacterized Zn-binding protein involved in type VI secretion